VAKPQHAALGGRRQRVRVPSDINHVRCRGAKSFVDDLGHSRGVVLSRAVHFCDLLRLSPLTGRFVRFRRTRLLLFIYFSRVPVTVRETSVRTCGHCAFASPAVTVRETADSTRFGQARVNGCCMCRGYGAGRADCLLPSVERLRCGKR
jgi:hypothetical protein